MKALAAEVSLHTRAPATQLWTLLQDVTQMGRWSPECVGGQWLGPVAMAESGRRFRGRNRVGILRWSTTCTIIAAEPGRLLTFDARHWSGAATRWTYTLTPDDLGTTVRESFRTINSPAPIVLLDRILGRPRRLRGHMVSTLQRLCADSERMP